MSNKNTRGYCSEKIIAKFRLALETARDDVRRGDVENVSISFENSKMGPVASVSFVPFFTCPAVCFETCGPKCYAAKIANLRPSVLRSYAVNQALFEIRPALFWRQVDAALKAVRFFRFNVAGDVPGMSYFNAVCDRAIDNPKTDILIFTKRYDVVNARIAKCGPLPDNLKCLFSGWENLEPCNPSHLPETNVIPRGQDPRPGWKVCGGNCFTCACRGVGCWQAGAGDVIAFPMR